MRWSDPESNRLMTLAVRPVSLTALAGLAVISSFGLAAPGGVRTAAAQARPVPRMAGKYAATFREVANNCSDMGMSLRTATVELSQTRERDVQVSVPAVPLMRGVVSRAGKFKAEARRGKTAIQGIDGRFSVAGRVDDKGIQFLFIAEYYRGKNPVCTQSWNASGEKQGHAPP
jgi:hypothetical protein